MYQRLFNTQIDPTTFEQWLKNLKRSRELTYSLLKASNGNKEQSNHYVQQLRLTTNLINRYTDYVNYLRERNGAAEHEVPAEIQTMKFSGLK